MKSAFLIIDMQKGCREFCKCQREFDDAVEYINEAAELFRKNGLPVVRVLDLGVGEGSGSEEFEFVDSISKAHPRVRQVTLGRKNLHPGLLVSEHEGKLTCY